MATIISDINIVDKENSHQIVEVDLSDRKISMEFTVKVRKAKLPYITTSRESIRVEKYVFNVF